MTKDFLYWFFMLLIFLTGIGFWMPFEEGRRRYLFGGFSLIVFLLFVIIGLALFGSPIK